MEPQRVLTSRQGRKAWLWILFVLQCSCAADRGAAARRPIVSRGSTPDAQRAQRRVDARTPASHEPPRAHSRGANHGPACAYKVIVGGKADAQLLMIFGNVDDLNAAIRTDSPQTTGSPVHDPCAVNVGAEWGEYHAPEVNWYYACTGGKIVAGRRSKEGDSQEKELYLQSRGHFAIAFLARADFLCPERPEEHCYPNDTPEPLLCESDFSIPCEPEGQEGILEILDVANHTVHRLEDVRHVRNWDTSLLPGDRLRLSLNDCVVDL